ncbi:hypothetical protein ACH5RR_037486 [Cinchona calisaya]|uniref:Uncharacterized protein n=1 Tax=Cinchona calisaya TaxID=153742 RepID=A0ABD2Y6C4_9GENT
MEYCIKRQDHEFDNFELPQVDDALLMSFLDDTQVEDCDDEKLSSVIRSLEAEIHQQNSLSENNSRRIDDLFDRHCGQFDDHDQVLDFDWMDMEMDIDIVPSSPSDGMASWYMDPCGDDLDGVAEFGSEKDYYFQHLNGTSHEDHEGCSYGALWQETNAPLVH